MAQQRRRRLPSEEQVWETVREFAEQRRRDKHPVPTLKNGVVNTITDVQGARIERASAQGRTNKTPIYRGEILKVWRDLAKNGQTRKAQPNYFTLALLAAALSEIIDDLGDGSIALRGRAGVRAETTTPFAYAEAASEGRSDRPYVARDLQLRESDAHWDIKHFIYTFPDQALAGLSGGPWTPSALELQLRVPTSDRIDVIVKDASGYRVLIEVKPGVGPKDIGLYAQASKYRAIWRVLHNLEIDQVRCAIAAPSIPRDIARHMLDRHRIESVAVKVPAGYKAPPRND